MPHMVEPIRGPQSVETVREQLWEAHQFMVAGAKRTIGRFDTVDAAEWGTALKRTKVELSDDPPHLVRQAGKVHAFAEVVNQCATLERLMDELKWSGEALPDFDVQTCHPTTSSLKQDTEPDNDRPLFSAADQGVASLRSRTWRHRPVTGTRRRSRISSGWVSSHRRIARVVRPSARPEGRFFLVVSEEFAKYLLRPTRHCLKTGVFHYKEVGGGGTTRIIEVIAGHRRPARAVAQNSPRSSSSSSTNWS